MHSNRKQITIISLGEIITINLGATMGAFKELVADKKSITAEEAAPFVGRVLKEGNSIIEDFKVGNFSEEDFTQMMINKFAEIANIQLTTEEFNQAWSKMSPTYERFKDSLEIVSNCNKPDQQVIFISHTNPKDMRHLKNELQNKMNYKVDNNEQLIEIAGIKLFTTYGMNKTKAELIEHVIKNTCNPRKSMLAQSVSKLYNPESEIPKIFYIRRPNEIDTPVLKEGLDEVNQSVDKQLQKWSVQLIEWDKNKLSLSDVLNVDQNYSKQMYML